MVASYKDLPKTMDLGVIDMKNAIKLFLSLAAFPLTYPIWLWSAICAASVISKAFPDNMKDR